jgi:hypothetical protein
MLECTSHTYCAGLLFCKFTSHLHIRLVNTAIIQTYAKERLPTPLKGVPVTPGKMAPAVV